MKNQYVCRAVTFCLLVTLMAAGSRQSMGQATATAVQNLQLTLPPAIYAVQGLETAVYFDNIVLSEASDSYRFQVTCDIGQSEDRRWLVTPTTADTGVHAVTFSVRDDSGQVLAKQSTQLHVIAADAGATRQDLTKLLIIGDSLTHASAYPNEIARLLSQPGNPKWTMLGTHKPASVADGVAHEGYGGWTWQRFVEHHEPNPDGTYRKRSSPFVFLNDAAKPELNVERYFTESCGDQRPDYIIIMLGINDCFGAPVDDPAGMDARIDATFVYADRLLQTIRSAAPATEIGICLTTPPNSRQEAFEANYKDRYSRWGWKRIQHRLVQKQLEWIKAKQDPSVTMIPTELNLDPVDGYPVNNGVHPNTAGYQQIGSTIFAWLKWRFASSRLLEKALQRN